MTTPPASERFTAMPEVSDVVSSGNVTVDGLVATALEELPA